VGNNVDENLLVEWTTMCSIIRRMLVMLLGTCMGMIWDLHD
jgi:hypothetical protein